MPDATADYLEKLHQCSVLVSHEMGWDDRPPAEVLPEVLAELPDTPPRYAATDSTSIPMGELSPVAMYLLGRVLSRLPSYDDVSPPRSLSTLSSIYCLHDPIRTKYFAQAVHQGIEQLAVAGDGPIEVIDAGCGALPLLSIQAALASPRVRCTALELNPLSVNIAGHVIDSLGLQDQIKIVEADAADYQPPRPVNLLVSETLFTGLTAEPFVEIMNNLQPHVAEGGQVIPCRVDVLAAWVLDHLIDQPEQVICIYTNGITVPVVETDWQTVISYHSGDPLDEIAFSLDTAGLPAKLYQVMITSGIQVDESRYIGPNQSQITQVTGVRDIFDEPLLIKPFPLVDARATIRYRPGGNLRGAMTLALVSARRA